MSDEKTPFANAFGDSKVELVAIEKPRSGLRWLKSPLGISGITFIILFVLLLVLNPPIVRKCPTNVSAPQRDWSKILIVSGVGALAVLVGPYASNFFGK